MIYSYGTLFLTQYQGKILGPVAWVLGKILNWIYLLLSQFGIENAGLCIIIFTFFVNALILPFNIKQQKFSKLSSVMQPELAKINEKYKDKKDTESVQRMQLETQAVYQKYGVNPTSGCLPLLITMPVLLALYRVIYAIPAYVDSIGSLYYNIANALQDQNYLEYMTQMITDLRISTSSWGDISKEISTTHLVDILSQFKNADWEALIQQFPDIADVIRTNSEQIIHINTFFGNFNIVDTPGYHFPGILLPILAVVLQLIQVRLMPQQTTGTQSDEMNATMQSMKTMNTIMPIFSGVMCIMLPIGVGIYWVAGYVFRILQQICINRYMQKIDVNQLIEKNVAKAKKRNEKLGIDPEAVQKYATQRTSNINTNKNSTAGRANVNVNRNKDVTEKKTSADYKPGSIAQRARLVSRDSAGREEK
jgi:YidC/Oxa1 family membrane protein insertase